MSEGYHFPVFEKPTANGSVYVNWRGCRWQLMTPIRDTYNPDPWRTAYPTVELAFRMCPVPSVPAIDPFEDHPCIVRGDN